MADVNEICRMDTVTLAGRVKAKELSPVEVVEAVLGRLERLDPVLHAFTTVTATMRVRRRGVSSRTSPLAGRWGRWRGSRPG